MNDFKNLSIAWISSTGSLFAAIEYREAVAIVSAVVLPVVFFTVGKTVDVLLQVYLERRRRTGDTARADETDRRV